MRQGRVARATWAGLVDQCRQTDRLGLGCRKLPFVAKTPELPVWDDVFLQNICFAPAQTPSTHGWPVRMASLPSFLHLLPQRSSNGPYLNAVYNHPSPLGPAHCLWWPPLKPGMRIETIVLFIPGRFTCCLLPRHKLTRF